MVHMRLVDLWRGHQIFAVNGYYLIQHERKLQVQDECLVTYLDALVEIIELTWKWQVTENVIDFKAYHKVITFQLD